MVDITLGGLPGTPIACIADTGAHATRMSATLASLAGIELDSGLTQRLYVGGLETVGIFARVVLSMSDATDEYIWDAPVWFCDPWPHQFGLAGVEGFFHHFVVTFHAYDGYLEVDPIF